MRLLFWIIAALSLLGGVFIALTSKSPIPFFSGIVSLFIFGWMAELIHGVTETQRNTREIVKLLSRPTSLAKAPEPVFERDAPPANIRHRVPDVVPVASVASAYSAASTLNAQPPQPD